MSVISEATAVYLGTQPIDKIYRGSVELWAASADSPPAAPTGLAAVAVSDTAIDVTWADASDNETGFVVERDTTNAFAAPTQFNKSAGVQLHQDTGLSASTTYWYRVKATNAAGDSAWATAVSATTNAAVTPAVLSDDGAWSWFSTPNAIYDSSTGRIFGGGIRSDGDVMAFQYDLATDNYTEANLHATLEVDDHDNPAVLKMSDGTIAWFYCKHGSEDVVYFRRTSSAGDITTLGVERTIPFADVTYANPVRFGTRTFLFGRTWPKPAFTYSDDDLANWTTIATLYNGATSQRPYVQYADNGTNRIHFFATPGHPRDVTAGSCHLYHWYLDTTDNTFKKSDGTSTGKTLASVAAGTPLESADLTLVYDASTEGNAWCWSIELDGSGNPVVTYAVFITDDNHSYRYAHWTGSAWEKHTVVADGPSLYGPAPTSEPQYSGGIVVDPDNTSTIYLARVVSGQWELEKRVTADHGTNWTTTAITSGSGANKNFRPFCIKSRATGVPDVIWCRGAYTTYTNYNTDLYAYPGVTRNVQSEVIPPSGPVATNHATAAGAAASTSTGAISLAGPSTGHAMYVAISLGVTTVTISTPAGWTLVHDTAAMNGARCYVFRRIKQSGDTSQTFTFSGATDFAATLIGVSGAHATTPEDVTAVSSAEAGSPYAGSITTVTDNACLLWLPFSDPNSVITWTSTITELADVNPGGPDWVTLAAYTENAGPAGVQNSPNFVQSATQVGGLVAVAVRSA